jgi:hypothetical protein
MYIVTRYNIRHVSLLCFWFVIPRYIRYIHNRNAIQLVLKVSNKKNQVTKKYSSRQFVFDLWPLALFNDQYYRQQPTPDISYTNTHAKYAQSLKVFELYRCIY